MRAALVEQYQQRMEALLVSLRAEGPVQALFAEGESHTFSKAQVRIVIALICQAMTVTLPLVCT